MKRLQLVALALFITACAVPNAPAPDAMTKKETPAPDAMIVKFPEQVFAAHFTDSAPKHSEALSKSPEKIVINFNFTLDETSNLTLLKNDKPIDAGKPVLASNKLSMSANLPASAGDGLYVVKYKACWPDKSCHDGLFAFQVDSKMVK